MLAVQLARCVECFRNAGAKEEQKLELGALVGMLETEAMTLREAGGQVTVNGTTVGGPSVTALLARMALHGITGINVPRSPLPAEMFELIKALAGQPGVEGGTAKLEAAGLGRVFVLRARPSGASPRMDLGTDGLLHGEPMTEKGVPVVPIPGVPFVTHDPLPPFPPPPEPSADDPPRIAFSPAVARTQTSATLLEELDRDPEAPNVGDLLAVLGRQTEDAVHNNRHEHALAITAAIVRLEQRVPEGSARRHYGIALRRMYTMAMLKGLAGLLEAPKHQADAVVAMRRGGLDAVDVLIDRLIAAPAISERRAMFDTLRQMPVGREQLVPLLHHQNWFVVRNIAELIGELGLEDAVPELAECLGHGDERVRKAVATALAKIGTPGTADAVRRALKDTSPDVRIQVALGLGARRRIGAVRPLVTALQEEEDEGVRRELVLALGRIGTPDAVQALIKFAQPSGQLFNRKPVAIRLAAVEALRLAGTAPALGTLEGLSGDGDKQVRAAAQAGVAALTKKR